MGWTSAIFVGALGLILSGPTGVSAQASELDLLPGYEWFPDECQSPTGGTVLDAYLGARWSSGWSAGPGVGAKWGGVDLASAADGGPRSCPIGATKRDILRVYGEGRYVFGAPDDLVRPFVGVRAGGATLSDAIGDDSAFESSLLAGVEVWPYERAGLMVSGSLGVFRSAHITKRSSALRIGLTTRFPDGWGTSSSPVVVEPSHHIGLSSHSDVLPPAEHVDFPHLPEQNRGSFYRVLAGSTLGWVLGAGTLGYVGLLAGTPTESWFGPTEMWLGAMLGGTVGATVGGHLINWRRGNPWVAGAASVAGTGLLIGAGQGFAGFLIGIPLVQVGVAAAVEWVTGQDTVERSPVRGAGDGGHPW